MKYLALLRQAIIALWGKAKRGFRALVGREQLYRVQRVEDDPMKPSPGVLYVIDDAGQSWAAAMACPGGCGQVLHMNLIADTTPVWRLVEHPDGTATLSPSVWRQEGCGCHFWLRRGRVEWCGRDGG